MQYMIQLLDDDSIRSAFIIEGTNKDDALTNFSKLIIDDVELANEIRNVKNIKIKRVNKSVYDI